VRERITAAGLSNVEYRYVPLSHPMTEPEQAEYTPTPAYVAVADALPDRSIDFAVVDGHYRTNCIRHLVPKMAQGGYLLVDDVNLWPSLAHLPIPSSWPVVDDSTNGVKRCVVWQATWP